MFCQGSNEAGRHSQEAQRECRSAHLKEGKIHMLLDAGGIISLLDLFPHSFRPTLRHSVHLYRYTIGLFWFRIHKMFIDASIRLLAHPSIDHHTCSILGIYRPYFKFNFPMSTSTHLLVCLLGCSNFLKGSSTSMIFSEPFFCTVKRAKKS